jgi:hypothetical protein
LTDHVVASPKDWQYLREAKLLGEPCRGCGGSATELFHLTSGGDIADNLIPLCKDCRAVYGGVGRRRARIVDAIRSSLSTSEHTYVLETRGRFFLDRFYPAIVASCPYCRTELDEGIFCATCGPPPYRDAA